MFSISLILQRHVKNLDTSPVIAHSYDGGLIVYNYDARRDYDS